MGKPFPGFQPDTSYLSDDHVAAARCELDHLRITDIRAMEVLRAYVQHGKLCKAEGIQVADALVHRGMIGPEHVFVIDQSRTFTDNGWALVSACFKLLEAARYLTRESNPPAQLRKVRFRYTYRGRRALTVWDDPQAERIFNPSNHSAKRKRTVEP